MSERESDPWLNIYGEVVHPDAPRGGAGAGASRSRRPLGSHFRANRDELPMPHSAAARYLSAHDLTGRYFHTKHPGSMLRSTQGRTPPRPEKLTKIEPDRRNRPKIENALVVPKDKQLRRISYDTMVISQFSVGTTEYAKQHACFKAAKLMVTEPRAGAPNASLKDSDHVIRVAEGSADFNGRTNTNPKKAALAIKYIDSLLDHGLRVLVGLCWGTKYEPRPHPTNHYVAIYGRDYDASDRLIYRFKDPGTERIEYSDDVFFVDSSTRKLFRLGSRPSLNVAPLADYEVTQVRTYEGFPPPVE